MVLRSAGRDLIVETMESTNMLVCEHRQSEKDDEYDSDGRVKEVGEESSLDTTNGSVQNDCTTYQCLLHDGYEFHPPPKGIRIVAAARCMPVMPTTNCDPARIILEQPKILLMRLSTAKTTWPKFPYRFLTISNDV